MTSATHAASPSPLQSFLREMRVLLGLTAATWVLALLALPLLLLLLVSLPGEALAAATQAPQSPVEPAALARAVAEMEQLDRLRVGLASTLEGRTEEPTMETMKEVCKPVGMRAAAIGRENGWQVRQVATKFRNPDHAPASAQEREVIDLFRRQPAITGLWQPASAEQGAGVNYYRRINVEPSCLACHGTKAGRPAFVKDRYPEDEPSISRWGICGGCMRCSSLKSGQPLTGLPERINHERVMVPGGLQGCRPPGY